MNNHLSRITDSSIDMSTFNQIVGARISRINASGLIFESTLIILFDCIGLGSNFLSWGRWRQRVKKSLSGLVLNMVVESNETRPLFELLLLDVVALIHKLG